MKNQLKNQDEVKKYLFVGIVLIVVFWGLNNMASIGGFIQALFALFMPFIIGGVIAFIFNVPMRQIEKHLFQKEKYATAKFASVRRVCAYAVTLVLIIAVITTAMFVVLPELIKTIADLIMVIPQGVSNLQKWLLEQLTAYPELEKQLASIQIDWSAVLKSVFDFISVGTKGLITGGIGAVSGIISWVTNFVIGFVFSIYILFQKERLGRQVQKIIRALLPEKRVSRLMEIVSITNTTFANFLSGQCLEAVILGSMFVLSMTVLKMPYAFLIGVVIAVTALIPIVGAFIGCFVGIILIGLTNPLQAVGFVVLFLVLQQIEGNLIYPHVVGNSVGLPGIWVLVAVTVGGNLFGIAGMLTFIPVCSVAYALFRVYINQRLRHRGMEKVEGEEKTV